MAWQYDPTSKQFYNPDTNQWAVAQTYGTPNAVDAPAGGADTSGFGTWGIGNGQTSYGAVGLDPTKASAIDSGMNTQQIYTQMFGADYGNLAKDAAPGRLTGKLYLSPNQGQQFPTQRVESSKDNFFDMPGLGIIAPYAALAGPGLVAGAAGGGAGAAGGGFNLFDPSTWSNPFSGMFSQGAGGRMPAGNLLADAGTSMTDVGAGTLGEIAGGGGLPPVATGLAGGAGQGLGAGAGDWWTGMGLTAADVGAGAVPAAGAAGGLFSGIPLSTLMGLGSGVSSLIGASAAQRAAQQQAGAANQATNAQLGMFNTLNQQGAPYRAAGYGALGPLTAGIGLGPASGGVDTGQFTHQFNAADLNSNLAPNYEFMKQQGLGATQNLLNASGGSLSGNTLQGLTKFGTDYAGTGYQNAFNNYTTNQNNIFGRLSQIAGLGTAANQQSAGAGASISPGISQSIQTGGGALASGTVGAANAMTGGINNALGWYALPQLLNKGFG